MVGWLMIDYTSANRYVLFARCRELCEQGFALKYLQELKIYTSLRRSQML